FQPASLSGVDSIPTRFRWNRYSHMTDVIELDSDEDIGIIEDDKKNAGASIDIVNSVPLDLSSIFGSAPMPKSLNTNGHHPARFSHQTIARPPPTFQRTIPTATVRLATNGYGMTPQRYMAPPGIGIRSSTTSTHTTSFHTLPRPIPQQFGRPLMNSMHNGSMNAMRNVQPAATAVMKMRLQLAQNGSYQRVPVREAPVVPPPVIELAEEVSDHRLYNYAFDAEKRGAPRREKPDGVMSNHRFRCTYGSCTKLIFGNINFMNHAWSHVAVWKATDESECERGKTDVDAISCCTQCMARFETPYAMQVHYTRAHSRIEQAVSINTCAICEKELTSLRHHLSRHNPTDAPFRCPGCSYRCTLRMHLYDHFCRRHAHGTMLMCPFCSFSTTVNTQRKRKHAIKAADFIHHLRRHELVSDKRDINRVNLNGSHDAETIEFDPVEASSNRRRIACDKCSKCFTNQNDRCNHLALEHAPLKKNYVIRKRKMETRTRRKGELTFIARGKHAMCNDCQKLEIEERPKKCVLCARAVFSIHSVAAKNISYSDNVVRAGVYTLAKLHVQLGRCACGFSSRSGNRLAAHFYACKRLMRVQLMSKERNKEKVEREPTKEEEKQEKTELAIFAIEKEKRPNEEGEEALRETLRRLTSEVEKEIYDRIAIATAPPPKKPSSKNALPSDPNEALDLLIERLPTLDYDLTEAMQFRCRIARNDYAESEKEFKELMARREED
ncbi:hypothetical protein PFISCL1PPCAC_18809, partial [Pristionchus fissidentatus]